MIIEYLDPWGKFKLPSHASKRLVQRFAKSPGAAFAVSVR